jgi:hypothetical protein
MKRVGRLLKVTFIIFFFFKFRQYNNFLILEQVGFEKKELTRESFIKLSKIEISQADVDFKDIWTRLLAIGFNTNLELDQVGF